MRVEDFVNRYYDSVMFAPQTLDLCQDSLMNNVGFRTDPMTPQPEASRALVQHLLEFAPNSPAKILDVACGLGGTTRALAVAYGPEKVTAINISDKQLTKCREVAPGATFLKMNATRMEFADETFDLLLCVEAAFHFRTRQQFFREAHRVLKPGGRLVLSDMLFRRSAQFRFRSTNPSENYVRDIETYKSLLEAAGFARTEIVDATEPCWNRFYEHMWWREKQRKGISKYLRLTAYALVFPRRVVNHIVLGWAEKRR